jgi:hypothetical protein
MWGVYEKDAGARMVRSPRGAYLGKQKARTTPSFAGTSNFHTVPMVLICSL